MKCLRQFYHRVGHHELASEEAFQALDSVLSELYGIVHFSIFCNSQQSGCLTSLHSSRDGIYAAGDRIICVNQTWFNEVMIKGHMFSTSNKLEIYDSFVKGFDFLALGAESLISFPVCHQNNVIGVVNVTLPRHLVSKEEVVEMENILSTIKPYIFDSEHKFKHLMPGARIDLMPL